MPKGNSTMAMASFQWDFLLLFLLLVITAYLDRGVSPLRRLADLQDPSLQFPHLPDIIPNYLLLLLSAVLALSTFILAELSNLLEKRALFFSFLLGFLEATISTVFLTNILKLLIGRPRPYFATVCIAYAEASNTTCTGAPHTVAEARKSFPSGHSSLAFAVGIYLALYLSLRLRSSSASPNTWRLLIVLLPPFLASLVAASRTIDYHHHFSDVLAGAGLGSFVAVAAFSGRRKAIIKVLDPEVGALMDHEREGASEDAAV